MAKRPKASKARRKSRARKGAAPTVVRPHNIEITDTPENWVAWGKLVLKWIRTPSSRPTSVGDLKLKMRQATPRVYHDHIEGADGRGLQVIPYSGNNILIPIPADGMIGNDRAILQAIANSANPKYPLPEFYSILFGGAPQVNMTYQEMEDMALRRLGEYVINECM